MSDDVPSNPARRVILRRGAVLAAFGAALAGAGAAQAAATTAKSDVKYQYTPKGSDRCGLCTSFIAPPASLADGPGNCKIVQGPIPQNGWCVLFSAK